MYKDKDKQREAVKLATRRYRERKQGITLEVSQGITDKGITEQTDTDNVIPEVQAMIDDVSANGGAYTFTTNKGKVQDVHHTRPKTQSYNPMMVGYVPPKE
jgi:hypothetical protein